MKIFWIFASLVASYAALIALVELLVWRLQPPLANSLAITTTAADGSKITRKLARHEHDGKLYVASNHWFRTWYHQALANPIVEIEHGGARSRMRATPVIGAEHVDVLRSYEMGFMLRLLCAFAPSRFLRLEPE